MRLMMDKMICLFHIYSIHPKYWDTLTLYHSCGLILTSQFDFILMSKISGWVLNSVDPDQMPGYSEWHLIWHYTVSQVTSNALGY